MCMTLAAGGGDAAPLLTSLLLACVWLYLLINVNAVPVLFKSQYLHKYLTNLISDSSRFMSVTAVLDMNLFVLCLCHSCWVHCRQLLVLRIALNCLHTGQSQWPNYKPQIATNFGCWPCIIKLAYLTLVKATWELPARWPSTFHLGTEFGPVFMDRESFVYTPRAKWGLCVGRLPAQSRSRH